ncbi:MAG TPA: zinc ABC transporter substrate-binding protein [Erysipelotrichaceae bacterium]|nr:zinc ABC transporter substrate-binding protein [Erysipelotrichaceae bacterium]
MKKIILIFISSILILTSLTACKLSVLNVGVTTYPIQYLVNRIAQDKVNVIQFSEGQTITRAQIVADYKDKLETTDVVFYFGKLEPYFSVYLNEFQNSSTQLIDLTSNAGVYRFQRYTVTNVGDTQVTLEDKYYESNLFDNVNTYDTDPMLWLDPITMISMAGTIKDWLIEKFPEEKNLFTSNYDVLKQELARLDADYQELWKQDIGFVSVTPSFGNWQKAYGVQVYPLILSRYGVLPSVEQLTVIKEKIKADGVKLIVHEPNLTEDMEALYNAVKTELELESIELHSLSFLSELDVTNNKNYMTIMFENLNTLEGLAP